MKFTAIASLALALVSGALAEFPVNSPASFDEPKTDFAITDFSTKSENGKATFSFKVSIWDKVAPAECTGTVDDKSGKSFQAANRGTCKIEIEGVKDKNFVDWFWSGHQGITDSHKDKDGKVVVLPAGRLRIVSYYMAAGDLCKHCGQEAFTYIEVDDEKDGLKAQASFKLQNFVFTTYTHFDGKEFHEL